MSEKNDSSVEDSHSSQFKPVFEKTVYFGNMAPIAPLGINGDIGDDILARETD